MPFLCSCTVWIETYLTVYMYEYLYIHVHLIEYVQCGSYSDITEYVYIHVLTCTLVCTYKYNVDSTLMAYQTDIL